MTEPPSRDRWRLTTANAVGYLRRRGIIPDGLPARAAPLSGGVSNVVLSVDWPGGGVVVKQALPVLRVRQRWEFDPARIVGEHRCMAVLGELLPPGSVPAVLDADDEHVTFTMSRAPDGGTVWKDALLQGQVDPEVADRAGALLGLLHDGSAVRPEVRDAFADLTPMVEGRIEPYHRTAAHVHPDLGEAIEADARRLLTRRRCLVLGDFSPKNILVYPDRLLLLDFEVAHWGDPAFDVAFLLTHLVLKAVHRPAYRDRYLAAARTFWSAYLGARGPAAEHDIAAELAVLLLCRVDGKSPVEYLGEHEQVFVREMARDLIARPVPDLTIVDAVAERLEREAA